MDVPLEGDSGRRVLDEATAHWLRRDLVAFLTGRSGDPELAEDLAQEALLRVTRGLPSFRGDAGLRTWAWRIALNVWRDHLRQRDSARRGGDLSARMPLDAIERPLAGDEARERHLTRECLEDAVRRLPDEARRVVVLRDFEDRPSKEIAEKLGCSVGAAKVRLHRARRKLARTCREECVSEVGPDGSIVCAPKPSEASSIEDGDGIERHDP